MEVNNLSRPLTIKRDRFMGCDPYLILLRRFSKDALTGPLLLKH
jgi:hypothetical protein